MKKILIASTIVGTAAAGIIIYLVKKSRARLIDKSAGVMEDDVHTKQKIFGHNHHPLQQEDIYSSAMG
ncbi:hypothetical protein [Chitinophaga flava]|uniref:Uncharacterized protein n=1 Tax=Chitinophaga flava TaxID=2259036 RepID=A0A365XZ25_9BACT|nr:hypothetical protein [Chitinophaga flava]RBL90835.1 hypothetical protein DF182_30845 [Chitinophaga flava]